MKKHVTVLVVLCLITLSLPGNIEPIKEAKAQANCLISFLNSGDYAWNRIEISWNNQTYNFGDTFVPVGSTETLAVDCVADPDYRYPMTIYDVNGRHGQVLAKADITIRFNIDAIDFPEDGNCSLAPANYLERGDEVALSSRYYAFLEDVTIAMLNNDSRYELFRGETSNELASYRLYDPDVWKIGGITYDQTVILQYNSKCYMGYRYWNAGDGWMVDGGYSPSGTQYRFMTEDDSNMVYISGIDPTQDNVWIQSRYDAPMSESFSSVSWVNIGDGVYAANVPDRTLGWSDVFAEAYCGGNEYGAAYCSIDLNHNSPDHPFVINVCNMSVACNGRQTPVIDFD
jgi:hypothetical protein